jgi:protein tyrosine phosphatase (PTP) superfamily phosphohydrolase (DUF442 family)
MLWLIVGFSSGRLVLVSPGLAQEVSEQEEVAPHAGSLPDSLPRRLDSQHLPNLVKLHPKVISGGLPEGEAAFRELAGRGIKTIISVDGAKPDVEGAEKFGLRYVHLPHGYDGVPESRVKELAKAVRELPGPIYVHCHHGKHRSPAAAAAACVAAGFASPDAAIPILELAGTSKSYRGLYRTVARVQPIDHAELDHLEMEFKPIVQVPPLAEAMVSIGQVHDRLNQIAEANWVAPEQHPDLDPIHEVLMLREHFTELLRTPEVQREPEDFRRMLSESEAAAKLLQETLTRWKAGADRNTLPPSVKTASDVIRANCKACHVRYRDN